MKGRPLANAAMLAALAASAVLPYLTSLAYHSTDAEVLILTLAAAAVGALLGVATAPWPRLAAALAGFAVYWIGDAYFANTYAMVPAAAAAGVATYVLLTGRFATNLRAMLTVFGLFWIVSNATTAAAPLLLAEIAGDDGAAPSSRPPLIHFIFDELTSPTAVAEGFPAAPHRAATMLDGFTRRGFEVHTDARSISTFTRYSISSLLKLETTMENWRSGEGPFTVEPIDNAYVRGLAALGYQVNIYQSNYLRLCAGVPGERCLTYSRAGHGHSYVNRGGTLWSRLQAALIEINSQLDRPTAAGTVAAYSLARRLLSGAGLAMEPSDYYSTSPAMLEVLDAIRDDLKGIGPGQAYVVHVMLPHAPYTLDQDCNLKPPSQWTRGTRPERPVGRTDAEIYAGYWDQAGCMATRLFEIADEVLSTPEGQRAIVMVQGDHGARVAHDRATGQDPNDAVQTLFAIRNSTSTGRLMPDPVVLQELFAATYRERVAR